MKFLKKKGLLIAAALMLALTIMFGQATFAETPASGCNTGETEVKFDANGGTFVAGTYEDGKLQDGVVSYCVTTGDKFSKDKDNTLPTVEWAGKTPAWINATDGTLFGGDTVIGGDSFTVKAVWTANDVTITFDYNGGYVGDGNDKYDPFTMTLAAGSFIYANPVTPEKEGYTFAGWSVLAPSNPINSDAPNATTYFNISSETPYQVPADSVTLLAQWKSVDETDVTEPEVTEPEVTEPTTPEGNNHENGTDGSKLPQTGSEAIVAAVVALVAGAGFVAVRKFNA